ncbi:Pyruvate formate-lyase 1-activating enzyme [Sinobacterium norvegicum]|uniref:Pyruvate formate-lyase-activating enzyme n=1 Tax=Sinobacterium norvegicum TaxID=1641715 RepID=A0ABM9A9Z9_9GAMM|nr:pyruvate formate-lyase-activating protein [Sinobacterium norvegicum]CAH0989948.1 Pyruvate formate-lyase 1-activating enzyme [Sinobacterium norvegicum]
MTVGRIHSIDSFGTVDGPGLRFVVFMQHCEMRCLYCHNPDTWSAKGGIEYSVEHIMSKLRSVKPFIKTGGLTVSGGEPLLQAAFVAELFEACRKEGIDTCLDTNGFMKVVEPKLLNRLLDATDLVLFDMKQADPEKHLKLTKVSNAPVLDFAQLLAERNQRHWLRHVVVPGWTTAPDDFETLLDIIEAQRHCLELIELLPYHQLGVHKWQVMNEPYELIATEPPLQSEMALLSQMATDRGFKVLA